MTDSEKLIHNEAEAIECLKSNKPTSGYMMLQEAVDFAIYALQKQIPQFPHYEGDGYDPEGELIYDTWRCPNCDEAYEVDYDEYDYCPNCGQRIDWSNKNE